MEWMPEVKYSAPTVFIKIISWLRSIKYYVPFVKEDAVLIGPNHGVVKIRVHSTQIHALGRICTLNCFFYEFHRGKDSLPRVFPLKWVSIQRASLMLGHGLLGLYGLTIPILRGLCVHDGRYHLVRCLNGTLTHFY